MNINTAKKSKSIYLFSLHIPLLLLILLLIGVVTGATLSINRVPAVQRAYVSENILGDEDKEDEKDEDGGDEDNESEDKKDEEDNSKEKDREDDSDDKNDDYKSNDSDAEVELEDSEEEALVSTVTNSDGTITKTLKKTDGDEVETKIITYGPTGKVISEQELNEEGTESEDKIELVSTVTNPDGTITKTFKKVESDETELKALTYDANGTLIKKAELNADGSVKEEEFVGKDEEEVRETEDESDEFELVFKPNTIQATDPALGTLIKAKIKQEIEANSKLGGTVHKLELEVKTEQGKLKFEGVASSPEKLFGLFNIEIPKDVEIDPITGKILTVNQSFWSKIIDYLSF